VLGEDGGERSVGDLIVIREFGEPVYPGLESVEQIQNGPEDAPWHIVINGENFHILQALRSTHRGKVDLIYIDPPYNTGNEGWIYNDRYVDQNDRAKSSKWLSFLERRLLIARDLLKPTGVIIAAIGDDEHHRLRMLLDQVFGDQNFLADIVWQGRVKNDKRFTGGGTDYMACYAKDQDRLIESDARWLETKPGVDELLSTARVAFEQALSDGCSPSEAATSATKDLRKWARANRDRFSGGLLAYQTVDERGRVFRGGPLDSPNPRPNLMFEVLHPATGQPVPTPAKGWRVSRDVMDEMIAADQVVWGKDHTTGIQRKLVLTNESAGVPAPTFTADRDTATKYLRDILGEQRFPNPKPHEVLMRWLSIAADSNAVVLDFFGGSGTTAEAVIRLNAQDGGTRQSILVTNNEVGAQEAKRLRKEGRHPGDPEWEAKGVFEYVCRPRVSTVVSGKRPVGSEYSDGLAANVEFFNLSYLDPGRVRRGNEYEAVAPLMWLEGGARGERINSVPEDGWALTESYGALFTVDALAPFAEAVAKAAADERPPSILFVITDSPTEYQQACERLPVGIETVRLYQDYLSNYTINIEGGVR
jgi:adenine-specific DNA-methyltransferase